MPKTIYALSHLAPWQVSHTQAIQEHVWPLFLFRFSDIMIYELYQIHNMKPQHSLIDQSTKQKGQVI